MALLCSKHTLACWPGCRVRKLLRVRRCCAMSSALQTAHTVIAVHSTHTQQLAPVHTGGHVWTLLPLPSCSALGLGCTVGAGSCMPGGGTQGAGLCNLPRLSSSCFEVQPGACPQGSTSHNRSAQHSRQHTRVSYNRVLLSPAAGRFIRREVGPVANTAVNCLGRTTARVDGTCN